jgi:hypothetical protein
MRFRILGSQIEYLQAAKRLEEIVNALPGTPQAQELKELIGLFLEFEKDLNINDCLPEKQPSDH